MNEVQFSPADLKNALDLASTLAQSAVRVLNDSPHRVRAGQSLFEGLTSIEAARRAYAARDTPQVLEELARARTVLAETLATVRPHTVPGKPDLAVDLLHQTTSAIEGIAHRIQNTTSRHTAFGAIRTPSADRMP